MPSANITFAEPLKSTIPKERQEAIVSEAIAFVDECARPTDLVLVVFVKPHAAVLIDARKGRGLVVPIEALVSSLEGSIFDLRKEVANWMKTDLRLLAIPFPDMFEFPQLRELT